MNLRAFFLALLATAFTTPGQIFYKLGAVKLPIIFTNWELALAVLFYFIAGVLFILALKTGELIQVFPVLATSYVWVSLAGMWLFGEVMTVANWVGIAFIVCGVAALALGRNK